MVHSGIIQIVRIQQSCVVSQKVLFQFRYYSNLDMVSSEHTLFHFLWNYHLPFSPLGVSVFNRVIHDSSNLSLSVFIIFFVNYCDRVIIYSVIIWSIVYSNWVILFCPNGAFMSSASAIHGVWCLPHILDISNIASHYIYYVTGFTIKVSSYGVWVVVLIRDDLEGVYVGASQASWLPTWLTKSGFWLEIYFWFY